MQGRPGKRTPAQRRSEILKRASSSGKYSLSGRVKAGAYAPKPVTLPPVKLRDVPDEEK